MNAFGLPREKLTGQADADKVQPRWPALAENPITVDYTADMRPNTDHATIICANQVLTNLRS
jgi:hypothetical protein